MKLDNMFKKTRLSSGRKNYISLSAAKPEVPEGLLRKCNKCGSAIFAEDVKKDYYICPKCGGYFRVHAYRRIEMVADEDTFEEWDQGLATRNPLDYKGYKEKLEVLKEKTGLDEAVITGKACIHGTEVALGVCDGRFLMASMGEVVGEKIARAVERATEEELPVIIFACSGGARMQEGITSLMQMAKTSAALKRHSDAGASLYQRTDGSYDRRRDGQFRHAGRRDTGRAEGADRIRRSQGYRADHRAETAEGIPAFRVPSGARIHRRNRGASAVKGDAVPNPETA